MPQVGVSYKSGDSRRITRCFTGEEREEERKEEREEEREGERRGKHDSNPQVTSEALTEAKLSDHSCIYYCGFEISWQLLAD